MACVHRNGKPPRDLRSKTTIVFTDMEFNENTFVAWLADHLVGRCQYDFIVFNGHKGKLNRTVEVTAWFQNKHDAARFAEKWTK